uniref:protein arginine N-methyltransferase 6 n=1 Tax=Ciona intestinalis TaxID=7719 RepID=UPI000180B9F5|nr:protein arginine N-methyltransferase 6 [Ciona intestinalis]|eukprot:XP_002120476.1 protein arginine N-methyltransferase 6 [Ciona intestinalis]
MRYGRLFSRKFLSSSLRMAGEFKAKRSRLSNGGSDKSYFESYADITVHEEMLGDDVRTNTYKKAIFNCYQSLKDKVVLDVGAGTGILSCFCAQAGAKKVYAIEASNIAKQAKKVVELNGLSDQIVVMQCLLEDAFLPEKVDVIVSEWMGYCLLYESMLSSVITARDRWLKPGGLMLPSAAALYFAPICDDEITVEKVNFWNDMEEVYGVDMSCILPFARSSISKDVMVKTISCENVLSHPQLVVQFDLLKVSHADVQLVQHKFKFNSFGIADFQGFALWFDVLFPAHDVAMSNGNTTATNVSDLSQENETGQNSDPVSDEINGRVAGSENEIEELHGCVEQNKHSEINGVIPTLHGSNIAQNTEDDTLNHKDELSNDNILKPSVAKAGLGYPVLLSTSPYKPETHWKQSLLYLNNEVQVVQDSQLEGTLEMRPCKDNHRFLNIKLTCSVDGGGEVNKSYFMGYELPKNKDEEIKTC